MKRKEKTFIEKSVLLAWCDTLFQSPELRVKRAANKIKGLAFEITTPVEVIGITKFLNDVIAGKDVDLRNYFRTQESFKRFFGHKGNLCAVCKKESFINLDGSKSVVKTTNEDMQCNEANEQIRLLRAKVASEK
jgi:hypothetical protein